MIAGAAVQLADVRGCTAAHLAAACGHAELLDKLLLAGYDVDTISMAPEDAPPGQCSCSTALHMAAEHGHLQVCAIPCAVLQRRSNERWSLRSSPLALYIYISTSGGHSCACLQSFRLCFEDIYAISVSIS